MSTNMPRLNRLRLPYPIWKIRLPWIFMTMELVSIQSFFLPVDQSHGGFGLQTMRERVAQIGGQLIMKSYPGEGTTLAIQIPVEVSG